MTPHVRTRGPVRIVGSGLLGASIGLGLRRHGLDVRLADASPSAERLAVDYGAGRAARADDDAPALVVVCVPPDVTAQVVAAELARWPEAIVTDVASVKSGPLEELRAAGAALERYVGSHPMAGRETGGPLSGRADLFLGRPWVIARHEGTRPEAIRAAEALALDLGAQPVHLDAVEHDAAVALISHAPQLIASTLAARLLEDELGAAALAGQGLRDVTRIASSDPTLWVQILAANGPRVARILRAVEADLSGIAAALEDVDGEGSRRAIAELMRAGNEGVARLPGKHGRRRDYATITVMIDDRPGQLARLFADIGDAGINLEDMRMEHSQGAELGLVEVSVVPEARQRLIEELEGRGWRFAL